MITGAGGTFVGRCFLFVTMPSGPISRRMATAIEARGGRAERVVLSGGDWIDWAPRPGVRPPRGAELRGWLERTVRARGVTDVVTLGDTSPAAAAALAAARATGVRRWLLEQGYLRPNWVTLEREGVNANSALPRDPAFYRTLPAPAQTEPAPNIAPITRPHAVNAARRHGAAWLLAPAFPHRNAVDAQDVARQALGHVVRYGRTRVDPARPARLIARLTADPRPFFVAFLQREGDSQLTAHSDLKSNRAFLDLAMASFARSAPPETRLVVKNHPLDPAVADLSRATVAAARAHGLDKRVLFLDGGAFAPLVRRARGVVTVNSTAALSALGFGVPARLLGRAVFDIEGLVDRRPLDDFWRDPQSPDLDLLARFRQHLLGETQVLGSFHNREHLDRTVESLLERMSDH